MNIEQEREAFKKHYASLFNLSEVSDMWGNPRFAHESVESIWYGWKDRAAVEADRRGRGTILDDPVLNAIIRYGDARASMTEARCADAPYDQQVAAADDTTEAYTDLCALLSRYSSVQPAASAEPSGYAYRYPDGIRFNDGCEVNGCKPTETLPYWFGAAPVAQEPVAWPKNAQEIRDFISTNFISREGGDTPCDDDKYFLTAHDLLSAFAWWADIAPATAQAQPAPMEAIGKLLTVAMEIAVANGANSVSMPDEYVEVAAWLCGIPVQPNTQDREDALTPAARDVLAERRRQISVEGWTPEHDDMHSYGVIARAAACYATGNPRDWPWREDWWKPKTQRRNLVRAGALILAEIDRLDRAAARAAKEE